MVQQENPSASHFSPFEEIRRESKDGNEYWSANGLAEILGYISREKFSDVIEKAEIACINSGQPISDQFIYVDEMIGAKLSIKDIHLSRYACYLVVQNADPSNENVALGQTYFAIQTRRQELADKLAAFPEEQKRLYPRSEMSTHNRQLAESARDAGVIKAQDFAVFQDHGYMGLYSGLRAQEIHTLKGLKQNQQILDHMGSEELADNIFRAAQTDAKLRREKITGREQANRTHREVGQKVRQTINELGGTMPEDLPTPKESIQQLQQKEQKRLKQGPQLSLFDEHPTETES